MVRRAWDQPTPMASACAQVRQRLCVHGSAQAPGPGWAGVSPWGMAVTPDTGVAGARPSLRSRLSGVLADIVALGAPSSCAACGRPGPAVCVECERCLHGAARAHRPSPPPPGWIPAHVVADYDGTTRAVMTAWKERGRRDVSAHLTRPLARAITAAVADIEEGSGRASCADIAIVPIPASPAARRRRGEDAWERVVRQAMAQCTTDARLRLVRALRLTRQPDDQAGLTASERRDNLAGAFSCVEEPSCRVIVVDDIITTGATLAEAARALTAAGADAARAAAIAATSRARASLPVTGLPGAHW